MSDEDVPKNKGGRPPTTNIYQHEKFMTVPAQLPETVVKFYDKLCAEVVAPRIHILSEVLIAYAEQRKPKFISRETKTVTKILEDKRLVNEMLKRMGIDRAVLQGTEYEIDGDFVVKPGKGKVRVRSQQRNIRRPPPDNPFEES